MMNVIAVVLAIGVLGGCGIPGDSGTTRNLHARFSVDAPTEQVAAAGTIQLSLPRALFPGSDTDAGGAGMEAAAVDTPRAQSDAEVIEILVIEEYSGGGSVETGDTPTVTTTVTVSLDDVNLEQPSTVDISVPAGVYYLLVLVGTQSGSTSCLLASGYTDTPVTVVPEQRSDVTVDVATISHAVTVPDTILAGSPYTITATGNTNSPVLTAQSDGSTDTYGFQAKYDTDSSLASIDATFSGSAWEISHTSDAPSSQSDVGWYSAWQLAGPYITYHDEQTGAWAPLDGDFSRKWRWLSTTVLDEDSQLWSEVFVPVVVVTSATGVNMEITW